MYLVPRNLFAVPVLGFPVSAFIIIMLKRQHFRLYYVETVAFVCTVSDLLSKWYTVAQGNSSATRRPKATLDLQQDTATAKASVTLFPVP